jgi:hypothetical protein
LPAEDGLGLLTLADVLERGAESDEEDEVVIEETWERLPYDQYVVDLAGRLSMRPSSFDRFERIAGHPVRPG